MTVSSLAHVIAWSCLAPGAAGDAAATRPADASPPTLVKRLTHWGYGYHHYRHRADACFKGPNVDHGFYDFLVRLPLFKTSVKPGDHPPLVIALHSRRGDFDRRERRWSDHVVLMPDDNTTGVGHSGWFGYHELAPGPPKPDTAIVPYTERRLLYYVRFALEKYHVDANRVWVTGGSMGGGGALLLALRHPEWITGAVAAKPPVDMRTLPLFRPMAEKVFGPFKWGLKVAGTDVNAWQATSATWLLSVQPTCRTWLDISHGRLDKIVPFVQYFTSVNPPGRGFLQLFEHGAAPGTFVWDMSGHGRGDPVGVWRFGFNPLAAGTIRMDAPTFVFADPSLGHLGVPTKLGGWRGRQRPNRDPRGMMNGFVRWDGKTLVDRPDRLEVDLWLSDEGAAWQQCPAEAMTYSVSPRGMHRFPIPPRCTFYYRVTPNGPSGRAEADDDGRLTLDAVPFRRGRANAVKLHIEHAVPDPVVAISSPTHPTPVPRAPTTAIVRWQVANSAPGDPMPVDRYRCWIAPRPNDIPPPDSETHETERVFESLKAGHYHVRVQARLVTGRWGPISARRINVDPTSPVRDAPTSRDARAPSPWRDRRKSAGRTR